MKTSLGLYPAGKYICPVCKESFKACVAMTAPPRCTAKHQAGGINMVREGEPMPVLKDRGHKGPVREIAIREIMQPLLPVTPSKKPKAVKVDLDRIDDTTRACVQCGGLYEREAKRGRPNKRCPVCR